MASGESNGHVTDDVTSPRNFKVVFGAYYLKYDWRYALSYDFM